MVPFERVSTVSYSHSIATMAVSLAVLTQNTNVADTGQKDRQTHTHTHTHSYRMAAKTIDDIRVIISAKNIQ